MKQVLFFPLRIIYDLCILKMREMSNSSLSTKRGSVGRCAKIQKAFSLAFVNQQVDVCQLGSRILAHVQTGHAISSHGDLCASTSIRSVLV